MAKRTGLGQRFWVCQYGSGPAYDLSGDVGAVDSAVSSFATIDATGLNKSAMERIVGQGDGSLSFTSFWNNATGGAQKVLSALEGLSVRALWLGSATEGDGLAYAIHGIFDSYSPARSQNASLTAKNSVKGSNGNFPDWGYLAAYATDASGTVNHTPIDLGVTGLAQSITAISIANPTHVTVTGHGLTSGDSVLIAGSNSTPVIDGDQVVTVLDANTFTVPVNVTGSGSAGTAQSTSSRLGGIITALLQSIGTGTNYTLQVQHSADNGVADAWANVTGLVTTALTAAAAESRVRVSSTLIKRWVRVVGAGTYTNAVVAALVKRIQGAE